MNVLIPETTSLPVFEIFPLIEFVTVVAKLASLPNAVAISFKVFNVTGAESTKLATAVWTNSVFAICFVFVPGVGVSTVGMPDNFTSSIILEVVIAESAILEVVIVESTISEVEICLIPANPVAPK